LPESVCSKKSSVRYLWNTRTGEVSTLSMICAVPFSGSIAAKVNFLGAVIYRNLLIYPLQGRDKLFCVLRRRVGLPLCQISQAHHPVKWPTLLDARRRASAQFRPGVAERTSYGQEAQHAARRPCGEEPGHPSCKQVGGDRAGSAREEHVAPVFPRRASWR
jgi:hypothetical protein